MLKDTFTLTKRHIGLLMLLGGIGGILLILGVEVLQIGREGGIGPAQRQALIVMSMMAAAGLTLIPLGNDPA